MRCAVVGQREGLGGRVDDEAVGTRTRKVWPGALEDLEDGARHATFDEGRALRPAEDLGVRGESAPAVDEGLRRVLRAAGQARKDGRLEESRRSGGQRRRDLVYPFDRHLASLPARDAVLDSPA